MSGQLEKPPSSGATLDRAGSGNTGTSCQYSGPYKCSTHPNLIVSFQQGQPFPVCPIPTESSRASAGHSANWLMVRETDANSFNSVVQRGGSDVA